MNEGTINNVPRVIAELIVRELRERLNLGEDNCYLAAVPGYVDGMPISNVVQVCPGDGKPWGEGDGWQDAGELARDASYTIACWFTVKTDAHGYSEEALTEAGRGVLDYTEKLINLLGGAMFGLSQQAEPMRYRGDTVVQIVDDEEGRMMKTISFSVPYVKPLFAEERIVLEPYAEPTDE